MGEQIKRELFSTHLSDVPTGWNSQVMAAGKPHPYRQSKPLTPAKALLERYLAGRGRPYGHAFSSMLEGKRKLETGGYVDRYGWRLLFFLALILVLNVLDAIFTQGILDHNGRE